MATAADFLCMFSLFESVVLYDHIWVSPADMLALDLLKPFVQSGDILPRGDLPDQLEKSSRVLRELYHDLRYGDFMHLSKHGFVDEAYESALARYSYADSIGIDSVIDPVLTAYLPLLEYEVRRAQLGALYDVLSEEYDALLRALGPLSAPSKIFIPPVPAVVLHRAGAGNYGRIVDELRSLRDEFEPYRNKYREYQAVTNQTGLSLKERANAHKQAFWEVKQALKQVTARSTASRLLTEDTQLALGSDLEAGLSSVQVKVTAPIEILAKLALKYLRIQIVRRRARALFDLWTAAVSLQGYERLLDGFRYDDSQFDKDLASTFRLREWLKRRMDEAG